LSRTREERTHAIAGKHRACADHLTDELELGLGLKGEVKVPGGLPVRGATSSIDEKCPLVPVV